MQGEFKNLPKSKQQAILNAAMEVFGTRPYKRASTDDIAAKAGISKGLLFYYFRNKKEMYIHLMQYLAALVERQVVDEKFRSITDFFDLMAYTADNKMYILEKHPYMLEFSLRAFYSSGEEVSSAMARFTYGMMDRMMEQYFANVDFSRFRPGIDPKEILHMLIYMADGYMHHQQALGRPVDAAQLQARYTRWLQMLRQLSYGLVAEEGM